MHTSKGNLGTLFKPEMKRETGRTGADTVPVARRPHVVVHRPRVPQDEVARLRFDFHPLASSGVEPVLLFSSEAVPVNRSWCFRMSVQSGT